MELLSFLDTKSVVDLSSHCSILSSGSCLLYRPVQDLCLDVGSLCWCICLGLPLCYKQILLQVHSTGTVCLSEGRERHACVGCKPYTFPQDKDDSSLHCSGNYLMSSTHHSFYYLFMPMQYAAIDYFPPTQS